MGRPTFESAYYSGAPLGSPTLPIRNLASPSSSRTPSPISPSPAARSIQARPTMHYRLRDWYPNITSSPSHSASIPLSRAPATPVLSNSAIAVMNADQQRRRARIMQHYISAHRARDADLAHMSSPSPSGGSAGAGTMPPPLVRSSSWTSSAHVVPNRVPRRPPQTFNFAYSTSSSTLGRRDALTFEDSSTPEELPALLPVQTPRQLPAVSGPLSTWDLSLQSRSSVDSSGTTASGWGLPDSDTFSSDDGWGPPTSPTTHANTIPRVTLRWNPWSSGSTIGWRTSDSTLSPPPTPTWEAPIDEHTESQTQEQWPALIRGRRVGSMHRLPVCPVCQCHAKAVAAAAEAAKVIVDETATFWTTESMVIYQSAFSS